MDDFIVVIFHDGTFCEFPFNLPPGADFDMRAFMNNIKVEDGLLTPNAWVPRQGIKAVFRKGTMSAPQQPIAPGQNAPTTESKQ